MKNTNAKQRIPIRNFMIPTRFVVHHNRRPQRRNARRVARRGKRQNQTAEIKKIWKLNAACRCDAKRIVLVASPDDTAVETDFRQRTVIPVGVGQPKAWRNDTAAAKLKKIDACRVRQRNRRLDVPLPHRSGGEDLVEHMRAGQRCGRHVGVPIFSRQADRVGAGDFENIIELCHEDGIVETIDGYGQIGRNRLSFEPSPVDLCLKKTKSSVDRNTAAERRHAILCEERGIEREKFGLSYFAMRQFEVGIHAVVESRMAQNIDGFAIVAAP